MKLGALLLFVFTCQNAMALRFSGAATSRDDSNKPPSIFFIIDTMEKNKDLQNAARDTWLQGVKKTGNDYRFFMFSDTTPPADMITLPLSTRPQERHPREMQLLRAAFHWSLNNTNADFIIKADHDMFVCSYHLIKALEQAPKTQYFSGYYFQDKALQGKMCRADQNFHVYSRDVLHTALEMTDHLPGTWELNWALTFGLIAKHLTVKGQLEVVDDNLRVNSHQGWHAFHPTQKIPKDYCRHQFAMHLFPSATHVNASSKMFDFVNNPEKGYTEPTSLAAPKCFSNIPQSCQSNWLNC